VGCDEDDAPQRYQDKCVCTDLSSNCIKLTLLLAAYNVCRLTADLSTVPDSKFVRARAGISGEEFFIAEFKLEATFTGGMIDWHFIFDGKSYGSVSVSYDH
jgi:hypothetical protein